MCKMFILSEGARFILLYRLTWRMNIKSLRWWFLQYLWTWNSILFSKQLEKLFGNSMIFSVLILLALSICFESSYVNPCKSILLISLITRRIISRLVLLPIATSPIFSFTIVPYPWFFLLSKIPSPLPLGLNLSIVLLTFSYLKRLNCK